MLVVVAFALVVSGCFTRRIAEKMGVSGWFRADVPGETYRSHFAPLPLNDAATQCPGLPADPEKPLIVLVHGIGGDGPEMEESLPLLLSWAPPAVYMFRWVPWDDRDEVAERMARGLSRLAACTSARILVLAHSAGGVVSSHAASRVKLEAGRTIDLLTVASPLAGTVRRAGNEDGRAEATLMLDLGSRITGYPEAAPGMHVVHLRTQAPADHIMVPSGDLIPNDPSVGVPGAPQLDLPAELGHLEAMVYVVKELIAGRADAWLTAQ